MYWPRCHSTNLKGPVPTGAFAYLLVLTSLPSNRCLGRLGVRGLDLGQLPEGRGAARVHLLEDLENGELHVGAGERLAVVELHALLQREGDRLAVGADGPRLRQSGNGLEAEVVLEQPF